jgi:hypothetical protein
VLFPYYLSISNNTTLTRQAYLLPAFQGVLLALAGGPLRREADVRCKFNKDHDPTVGGFDLFIAVWVIILVIVLLSSIIVASENSSAGHPLIDHMIAVFGSFFNIVAYISIVHGIYRLAHSDAEPDQINSFLAHSAILIGFAYIVIQSFWTKILYQQGMLSKMDDWLKYSFAACKVALSMTLVPIIIKEVRPSIRVRLEEERPLPTSVPQTIINQGIIQDSFNSQTVTDSYNSVRKDLQTHISELEMQINDLVTELARLSPEKSLTVRRDLAVLQGEVASSSPRMAFCKVAGEALIEAAKLVASLSGPVGKSVEAIISIIQKLQELKGQQKKEAAAQ